MDGAQEAAKDYIDSTPQPTPEWLESKNSKQLTAEQAHIHRLLGPLNKSLEEDANARGENRRTELLRRVELISGELARRKARRDFWVLLIVGAVAAVASVVAAWEGCRPSGRPSEPSPTLAPPPTELRDK